MKKNNFKKIIVLLVVFLLVLSSCSVSTIPVKRGAQGNNTETQWKWFALWGLIPISDTKVNAQEMIDNEDVRRLYRKNIHIISKCFSVIFYNVDNCWC